MIEWYSFNETSRRNSKRLIGDEDFRKSGFFHDGGENLNEFNGICAGKWSKKVEPDGGI